MELTEIIKEGLRFPSKDVGKLAIYIVLTLIVGVIGLIAVFSLALAFDESIYYLIVTAVLIIVALILSLVLSGYQLNITKSGIEMDDAPEFNFKKDLIDGIKYVVNDFVYFLIPAVIVLIVAAIVNIPGILGEIFKIAVETQTNSTANIAVESLGADLITAFAITGVVAIVLFIIFSFIATIGDARLANTGSLSESLNISEAIRDIGRIGWLKVIATVIIVFVICGAVNIVVNLIGSFIPIFSIVSIITTPYLMFFSSRVTGLLYSEIA